MGTTAEKLQKLMQTKDDIKTAINDPALGDKFADYPTAITDGKAYIAQKITEKGVAASRNDTFQQLGDKVGEIQSGEKWIKLEPISTFAPSPADYKQLFIPVNEDVKGIILRVDYSDNVDVSYNQLYVHPVSKPFSYGFINGAEIGYLKPPFSDTDGYNGFSERTTTISDNQFIFYCADIGDTLKNLWYMYIK